MRRTPGPTVVLLLLVAAFMFGCGDDEETTEPVAAQWYTETVDSVPRTGQLTSLAVDAAGLPHIVYFDDPPPNYLKYAYFNGTAWEISVIDANARGVENTYTTILIDDGGNPHVGYADNQTSEIRYAHRLIGGWQVDTVDSDGQLFSYPSMALGRNQMPVFAYGKEIDTTIGLFVAYLEDSAWVRRAVDTTGLVDFTSVGVDTGGVIHIAYTGNADVPGYDLLYASGNNLLWTIDTVIGESEAGQFCSLDLMPDGAPRIAFRLVTPAAVGYAELLGGSWVTDTFDTIANDGLFDPARFPESIQLALGAGGAPHVAYWDWSDSALVYGVRNGQWMVERADSEGSVGAYCDIAVDSEGRPHISYQERDSLDLKYAVKR